MFRCCEERAGLGARNPGSGTGAASNELSDTGDPLNVLAHRFLYLFTRKNECRGDGARSK